MFVFALHSSPFSSVYWFCLEKKLETVFLDIVINLGMILSKYSSIVFEFTFFKFRRNLSQSFVPCFNHSIVKVMAANSTISVFIIFLYFQLFLKVNLHRSIITWTDGITTCVVSALQKRAFQKSCSDFYECKQLMGL